MAQGAKRGAIWGGAIGASLGLLGAVALASDDTYNAYPDNPSSAGFGAQIAAGGLMWGAIIGAFVKAERWDHASIQPRVGSKGVGVGIALR